MHMQRHRLLRNIVLCMCCLTAVDVRAQVTAFRMNDLDLRDPHVYVSFIGCRDVTDTLLLGFAVNSQLQTSIQTDASNPPDGLLDLSNVFLFDPLDQGMANNIFATGAADCTAPMAGTTCSGFSASALSGLANLLSAGTCLVPESGTTHGYLPAIVESTAPCFSSPSGSIMLDLGGIPVLLQDAQIAATFTGTPVDATSNGLMRGFLLESDADVAIVPATFPVIGGLPLSQLLPGGDPPGSNNTNCASHSDVDIHNGQRGWWFYLNFTAPVTPVDVDPFSTGFGDGFE